MSDLLHAARLAAEPYGLNLIAALPAERYEATAAASMSAANIDDGARGIIVIGNGGGEFWRAFSAHADRNPGWRERPNPLDDFTQVAIEERIAPIIRRNGVRCTSVYPFVSDRPTLNFMELAKLAGIAGPSIIGVVVNPTYGPWIALRAALLIDREIDVPGPALGFDPCPSCAARTCISACPAEAISATGWDIPKCLTHRVESEADCAARCHARLACVLGPDHRYPADELAYHQERALRAMRPYYEKHIRPLRRKE